ncbi:MAG: hypothetical protein NW218_16960 [Saprospiraceae bacterium]|nr:hypothetical protein [Saprospiraceae bacterium]
MRFILTFLFLLGLLPLSAQPNPPLSVELLGVDITCSGRTDGAIRVALTTGLGPVMYQWSGNGLSGMGQVSSLDPIDIIKDLPAGTYTFNFTDTNGAVSTLSAVVANPPALQGNIQVQTDYNGFGVSCPASLDGRLASGVIGGVPPYYYQWSTGRTSLLIDSLGVGTYQLTVTDGNNCSYTTSTTLTAPTPIKSTIKTGGDRCFGQNQGFIEISGLSGGIGPYQIVFEDEPPVSQFKFENLQPGTYFFSVVDENGCAKKEAAILPTGVIFTINIGADSLIYTGDTLLYAINANRPLASVNWEPAAFADAQGLDFALLYPAYTTLFKLTATDTSGCAVEDEVLISVQRKRNVYVPNVLSLFASLPENQAFTVYGSGGITEVVSLRVLDRFGRLWFEKYNFPINQPSEGWDGTWNGNTALPGVYIWETQVRFSDGRLEKVRGDVTLLR